MLEARLTPGLSFLLAKLFLLLALRISLLAVLAGGLRMLLCGLRMLLALRVIALPMMFRRGAMGFGSIFVMLSGRIVLVFCHNSSFWDYLWSH